MPRVKRIAALAASIPLAACSLAPAYRPVATATPAAYKEAAPLPAAGWSQAAPQDQARGAWWQVFGDPVLDDLEARVEQASPTLAAALARYDQARAQLRVARADLFPQASASGSAERDHTSQYRPASTGRGTTSNDYVIGGTLSYEVDLWGRVRNSVNAAHAKAQGSAADLANVRLSLQAQLAVAYFQLRGLDAQHQLLDRTVQAYARAQDLTVTRHRGGIANGLDVSRAANILSDAKAQISDVLNQRAASEHQIAALIGENASRFRLPARDGTRAPPVIPAGLPSELIQHRPDVAEAERAMYAANANIGVARAAWFPSLTLGASGGWESTGAALLSNPATFWALGPAEALLTVFDGGRRASQVKLSRAQYDEAAANYRETVLTAFREVEDSLAASRLLAQQWIDERDAAAAAQKTEDLALVRYRDGASDYLDVVTAQTATLAAQRSTIMVETQRLQAAVTLIRTLGAGFRSSDLARS